MRTVRIICAAMLILLGVERVQAMPVYEFFAMTAQDQREYRVFLVQTAEQVLREQGRTAFADKIHRLFNEVASGDQVSTGEREFVLGLANARVRDVGRLGNAQGTLVESVLTATLKNNGIELAPEFYRRFAQSIESFTPKSAPK